WRDEPHHASALSRSALWACSLPTLSPRRGKPTAPGLRSDASRACGCFAGGEAWRISFGQDSGRRRASVSSRLAVFLPAHIGCDQGTPADSVSGILRSESNLGAAITAATTSH